MNQIEFNLGIPEIINPLDKVPGDEPNPMCKRVGYGPENATCKSCKHLIQKIVHSQAKFYKCKQQLNKKQEGKDYRLKWSACRMYEEVTA